MTLVIELTPEEEARLAAAAAQRGVEPAELARTIMAEHLPSVDNETEAERRKNAASIALLQSWLDEDATDDPEEIAAAERELSEFKQAVDAERERAGARRIYE